MWFGDPWVKKNAIFVVQKKNHFLMKKTCGCLDEKSPFRRFLAQIVLNTYFDNFVTICIIVNSIMLATRDYTSKYDVDFESSQNKVIDIAD